MAKKNTPSAVEAFRNVHTASYVPVHMQADGYFVPKIVKDMGQLIGLRADAIQGEWGGSQLLAELRDAYAELAATTSELMDWYSIETVSEEAVLSVGHRLAASVDPLVSLHARVDHLFRSFQQDEIEHVRDDTQKLWAALEFRSEAVTGMTFAQLLQNV